MRLTIPFFCVYACLAAATPVAADQALLVYLGEGGALDDGGVREGGVEWQFGPRAWGVRPIAGVLGSEESMRYVYAGLRRDFWLGRLLVAPYTGAGYYERQQGPNLGGAFQFRSGLELAVALGPGGPGARWRFGASFYHLSNASTDRPNPGTEAIVLTLSRVLPRRQE